MSFYDRQHGGEVPLYIETQTTAKNHASGWHPPEYVSIRPGAQGVCGGGGVSTGTLGGVCAATEAPPVASSSLVSGAIPAERIGTMVGWSTQSPWGSSSLTIAGNASTIIDDGGGGGGELAGASTTADSARSYAPLNAASLAISPGECDTSSIGAIGTG